MSSINTTTNKSQKINTKNLVITGMFTALICVLAQISIPVPPIPFSLGVFAIFLTGALLPPRDALFSVLAYLLLGAFGVPVFAGFKGGLTSLIDMTGGYKMAFPIMAFIIALSYKYIKKNKVFALALGMSLALIFCYLAGTAWFTFVTDYSYYEALALCVFPFIAFDIIKIVLAISVSMILRKSVLKHL